MQVDADFSLLAPTTTPANFVELRGDVELADNGDGVVLRNVSAGAECLAHYATDVALTPDLFVETPIMQRGAPDIADLGVFLRKDATSPAQTGYLVTAFFRFNNQAQHAVIIYKCVNGDYGSLVSQAFTLNPLTPYTLRGEAVTNPDGSVTITAKIGGTTVVSVTDSTSPITTGKGAGVRCVCSSAEFLEWQRFTAGDLGPQPLQITWSAIASGSAMGASLPVATGPAVIWSGIASPATRTVTVTANRQPQLVPTTYAQERVSLLDAATLAVVDTQLVAFDTPRASFTSVAPGTYRVAWLFTDATNTVDGPGDLSDPFAVSQMGDLVVTTGAVGPDGRRIEWAAIPAGSQMGSLEVYLTAPPVLHGVPTGALARRRPVRRPR